MKQSRNKTGNTKYGFLVVLLILGLLSQAYYLFARGNSRNYAQASNGRLQNTGAPPGEDRLIEPPPMENTTGEPGRMESVYPEIKHEKNLTNGERRRFETRYYLHRWTLPDLLWGVIQLEKTNKYALSRKQADALYDPVKNLADSVAVVEESNRLMKGLLTNRQNEYIMEKVEDASYMAKFLSTYSPGEAEPSRGVSDTILKKSLQVLEDKINAGK